MWTIGLVLLAGGALGCAYFCFLFATAHMLGPVVGMVDPGLVEDRRLGVLVSVGSAIVGAILFGLAPLQANSPRSL